MQSLHTLSLINYIPVFPTIHSTTEHPVPPYRTVSLPKLQDLSVQGDYSQCLSLIQSIRQVRPDIELSIRCPHSETAVTPHPHLDVLHEICKRMKSSLEKTSYIEVLSIYGPDWDPDAAQQELVMKACITRNVPVTEQIPGNSASFSVSFDTDVDGIETLTLVKDYCAMLPLQDVRKLDLVMVHRTITPQHFIDFFGQMQSLRTLEVSCTGGLGLPIVLKEVLPNPPSTFESGRAFADSTSSPRSIFPELESIKFVWYKSTLR